MTEAIRKAVIPVAGMGTRFLPATKTTPKEMLPVVDRPAIEYVVEEAVSAGLTDVLMVTGRTKRTLEDHFDRVPELEAALEAKGDDARLALVRRATELAQVHFVRQGEARGLGHAVLCAKGHVGDEPFAVLLGDDLIDERDPLLQRMVAVQAQHGGSVVALLEVPRDQVGLYGCAELAQDDATAGQEDVVRLAGMVEKPDPADAPSNLAIIGRYVLSPAVFEVLERTPPGRGGEIQLTDALQTLAGTSPEQGGGVRGVVFRGRRYDTGDKLDYLKAVVRLASGREDLGPGLREWLAEWVASGFDTEAPTHAPVRR
ncbi:UTP--glucose-1-phosphate uridylyltransferase GalU [Quadrisphaera sp. DSM 44207]|uniref:UTP--glucose-1-phosphate uridylyltransferase GalU n=1 Tax=Quadrisphaera sp. DSM 44207 TaxID=1881057 RepID=UPI0008804867|nr:UTP--glucose-1-phosphate uridylyltransferase GalU [Quadrisphaera sp. DSM 44207]SDQ66244.1 UDP-glucose pyrophosphorylase [Quadrisphaera sp. DSM 44207]